MPQKQNANDKTFSENIKIVKQKFLEKFQQNVYLMEIEFRFFLSFDIFFLVYIHNHSHIRIVLDN